MRSWIITRVFSNNEEKALKNNIFCNIFGTTEKEGKVIFFDAFPTTKPNIEPDIINNHYQPYYSGKEPPADYHSPNPIIFLTLKNKENDNTTFQFIIGEKKISEPVYNKNNTESQKLIFFKNDKGQTVSFFPDMNKEKIFNLTLLNLTFEWLKLALTEHGIGAKTAVGYGYMKRN